MKTNRWIDSSRRIYAWLLGLYPQEYRAEYGESMLQVFGDLCRDTIKEHGKLGILVLWIRTLFDLGKTTIHEHLTRSGIKRESVSSSDTPLPWKEMGLVLLPGIAFLFAYALMVLTNKLTFSSIFQYCTDLLAGIALLYFWRKNKIPVWGLVPLGLLAGRLIAWVNYLPTLVFTRYGMGNFIGTMTILLAALCLLIFQLKKHKFSGSSMVWLGIFLLIGVGKIVVAAYAYTVVHRHWNLIALFASPTGNTDYLSIHFSNSIFGFAKWFLLILIGTLLARRFGSLAILFLLGLSFSAGMIVFGQDQSTSLYLLTFTYCLLVTVVFPIWISRVFSKRKQTFLTTFLILLVLVFSTVFDLFVRQGWILSGGSGAPYTLILGIYICLSALLTGVGYLLALSLYRYIAPTIESQSETTILAPN